MPNDFYTPTGNPPDNSNIVSADMRAEFAAINAGFNKLPTLTGTANKLVAVNSSASGLDVCSTIEIGGTGKTLSLTGEGASYLEISSFGSTPIVRAGGGGAYLQLDDVRLIGTIQFSSTNTWVWEPGSVFASRGIHDSAGARVLTISGSGANSITIVNSATNPTIGTSAGDLAISSRVQASAGLTVSGATLVSRGLTDNATATALTLFGSGANSVTIASSATNPVLGVSGGQLTISTSVNITGSNSCGAYQVANNGLATPAGGTDSGSYYMGLSGFGIYFGSGAPTVSAAKGSIYLRSDGSATNNRFYVNTDGGTTWTAVTTAA